MNSFENLGSIEAQGGGGYPPGGYGPPGGGQPPGGWGPPGGPPPGAPPGGGQPPGGWGPPGGPPPGAPPGGGQPPGGWGPPGGPPPGAPPGGGQPPGGWGPPGAPPGGGGYGPPGAPPGGGGYGPPGAPPGGGGYGPPGAPPGGGGYGPPGAPPGGGGYGPPGAPPGGSGYGPPGGGYTPPPQYAPPGGGFQPPPYQPGAPPPGGGGEFQGTEAIGFGWNAVTKDFAGVALPLAVAGFVAVLPSFVLGLIRGGVVGALTASGSDTTVITIINSVGGLVNFVIGALVQSYVMGGMVQFALRVARGEKPEFGVVFGGSRFLLPLFGATLLFELGAAIGFAFCIVPGIFLCAAWAAYPAFVVDKNMGAIESLSASWAATAPIRMNIIIYGILAFFVYLAGLCACLVGALLVSAPVLMISNAYLYMKLNGEQPRLASG